MANSDVEVSFYPWLSPVTDLRSLRDIPVAGQPDDDEDENDEEDEEDEDDENEEEESNDDDKSKKDNPKSSRAARQAARYRVKAREKQQRIEELEAKLAQLESGDGGDEDRKAEVDTYKSEAQQARASEREARLELAFYKAAHEHDLIDPEAAYALLEKRLPEDLEEAEEDLPDLLEELVKKKPYLRKPKSDKDDQDEDSASGARRSGPDTNRRQKGKKGVDQEALKAKFPALRGR